MTSVAVSNLTALRQVTADSRKLRFVESERAWFNSDPSSTIPADGLNIISPNVGVGRWIKQLAAEINPSGWVWSSITTAPSTVQAISRGAYFCNASTSNPITLLLPLNPIIGDTVRVNKLDVSDFNRRIIIDRNGQRIQGQLNNIFLLLQGTDAELTYVDANVGWAVNSNLSFLSVLPSTLTSLNLVAAGDTNGLFHFIGTNRNTTTFTNPQSTAPQRVTITSQVSWSTITAGTALSSGSTVALTNRTLDSNSQTSDAFSLGLFIRVGVDTARQFRLHTLTIQNGNAGFGASRGFNVLGGNIGETTVPTDGGQLRRINWVTLATFRNMLTSDNANGAWNVYNISSTGFYSVFMIQVLDTANLQSVSNGSFSFSDIELYGDLVW